MSTKVIAVCVDSKGQQKDRKPLGTHDAPSNTDRGREFTLEAFKGVTFKVSSLANNELIARVSPEDYDKLPSVDNKVAA